LGVNILDETPNQHALPAMDVKLVDISEAV
jgi:hypothetical protein